MSNSPHDELSVQHLQDVATQLADSRDAIKAVAIYELVKGAVALLAAVAVALWHDALSGWVQSLSVWLYGVVGTDLGQLIAAPLHNSVTWAHKASQQWQLAVLGILAYASIRFIEAYGLWQDKAWAYWLSVLGYGVFIPAELYYLFATPFDWLHLLLLLLNLLIVWVVYRHMRRKGLI